MNESGIGWPGVARTGEDHQFKISQFDPYTDPQTAMIGDGILYVFMTHVN